MTPSSQPKGPEVKQRLAEDTIHDLQTPLTVIKAQAQMVQRWMRRNDIANSEVVMARLAVIDDMVIRMVAELDDRRDDEDFTVESRPQDDCS